jgi:hypothetical protein
LPSQLPLLWVVVEREPKHLIIDAREEGTGRRVRLVLSLSAGGNIAGALHALGKVAPGVDADVFDFGTKGKIEVA